MTRRRAIRAAVVVAALLAVLLLLTAVVPQCRAAAKTAGLVAQVIPNAPLKPLGWFTAEPQRDRVTYPGPNGPAEADLYRRPGGGQQAALILFLGVNPAGRDDERVINVATALARTGFVVLVPWSENMVSGRVDRGDVELLVAAFEYVRSLEFVDPERVGSGGFCVGSSLLTVAASDPRIRDDVRFINFFSGYFDGRDYLAQFGARQAFYADTARHWDVDQLTEEVFQRMLVEGLPDADEQFALAGHFIGERIMLAEQVESLSPEAMAAYDRLSAGVEPEEALRLVRELPDLREGLALAGHFIGERPISPEQVELLSPPALAVFRLLFGTADVEEARLLIEDLPPDMLANMDALSPRHYLDGLRADLWIMHDEGDALAPIEESRRLYDAVGMRDNVTFTEFSFFSHVDPAEDASPWQLVTGSLKLLRHLYRVVRVAT